MDVKNLSKAIGWWRVSFNETDINYITDAVRNECISMGAVTKKFEAVLSEQLQIPYVVATTSGSMSLLMAFMALGVGPDDEIIIPNRTWIASAHAAKMLGAKIVLVDVLPHIPIMDINQLEKNITTKTKIILPTSLNGRATNIAEIQKIAKRHGCFVVEDAAQALFSRDNGHYAGTQSEISCFSCSVAKLIPTGQGGFIATKSPELYQKCLSIRTHGVSNLLDCAFTQLGFNCRITDLQAALGLSQLKTCHKKIDSLIEIYRLYESGLRHCKKIKLIPVAIEKGEVPLYIEVLCREREALKSFLDSKNIQSKPFYPNLNRASYLEVKNIFPNSDLFETQGLTLPCGPDQPIENIKITIEAIQAYEHQHAMQSLALD